MLVCRSLIESACPSDSPDVASRHRNTAACCCAAAVARLSVGISITHTLIVIAAFYSPTPHPATAAAVARVASLLCNLNGGESGAGSALHSGPVGHQGEKVGLNLY